MNEYSAFFALRGCGNRSPCKDVTVVVLFIIPGVLTQWHVNLVARDGGCQPESSIIHLHIHRLSIGSINKVGYT